MNRLTSPFTPNPKIVLVSGAPGSGKTTLAVPLAQALNFSLITKDDIKETLYEALDGRPNDLAFSRKIGGAAWGVLWKLAAQSTRVVIESNFRPNNPIEQAQLAALKAQIIEVRCHCPPDEIVRRYISRDAAGQRHPAHALHEITAEQVAVFNGWMGCGTLIEVDTSHPIDIPALAQRINDSWE
jgi:predicted kinase